MAFMQGFLEKAVIETRKRIDEPQNSDKLAPATVLRRISESFHVVMTDLESQSERPFVCDFDYTLAAGVNDKRFLLPALCSNLRQAFYLDASGNVVGHIPRRRGFDSYQSNYGFELNGPYLRLVRSTADVWPTMRIRFEPGGFLPLHYGVLPSTKRDTVAGLWIKPNEATSSVGDQDYRPNAYVGAWFRVYKTATAPTGYTSATYNSQQQYITNFAQIDQKVTLFSALDFFDNVSGDWTYEILPTVDFALWSTVVIHAAMELANEWGRLSRAKGLEMNYRQHKRALLMQQATADSGTPSRMERSRMRLGVS